MNLKLKKMNESALEVVVAVFSEANGSASRLGSLQLTPAQWDRLAEGEFELLIER